MHENFRMENKQQTNKQTNKLSSEKKQNKTNNEEAQIKRMLVCTHARRTIRVRLRNQRNVSRT